MLVPLVVSTTSHQRDNAQWMAQHGAAIHLPQAELTPQRWPTCCVAGPQARSAGDGQRARALGDRPHAAQAGGR
jgi:UDP-N-acetylglucosamine--N-acetylmuramyl-(pentapeptide) pyrophosphoryl-undecaprenol N-acetylglucosamine transferase